MSVVFDSVDFEDVLEFQTQCRKHYIVLYLFNLHKGCVFFRMSVWADFGVTLAALEVCNRLGIEGGCSQVVKSLRTNLKG